MPALHNSIDEVVAAACRGEWRYVDPPEQALPPAPKISKRLTSCPLPTAAALAVAAVSLHVRLALHNDRAVTLIASILEG